MNNLKKLALATAIAAAPLSVNALEALDDDFLGDVTGQEGISIDKTYINTIEEFQYIDGDGDGSTGAAAGKIVISGITIDSNGSFVSETGQTIDATANGVRIGNAAIGDIGTDATSGKDIRINGISLGNAAGALASVGSVTIDNQHNYLTATDIATIEGLTEATGNAAGYVLGATMISSKNSGTGVVITSESFSHIDSVTYSDHDGAAEDTTNSVSIVGITSFRQGSTENSTADYLTSTDIRGAYSTMTIDVEGGKLVLSNQESVSSTIIDAINIGGTSVGSLAILGNRSTGSTSVYAH